MRQRAQIRLAVLLGVLLLAGIAVFAVARTGGSSRGAALSGTGSLSTAPGAVAPPHNRFALSWSFRTHLPVGWTTDSGLPSLSFQGEAMRVSARGGRFAYQLLAPIRRVPAGQYRLEVTGRILTGGIGLGVQDAKTKKWLAYNGYRAAPGGRVTLVANLPRARRVRLILTNSSAADSADSGWVISRVALRPVQLPSRWKFGATTPVGWSLAGGAKAAPFGTALRITTGAGLFEYALVSPPGYLTPGTHNVSVVAHVLAGGMGVGLLDVTKDKWLAYKNFKASPHPRSNGLSVTLDGGDMVRVVLANLGSKATPRSAWDVASVSVR